MNIKISKAFRTMPSEAIFTLAGTTPMIFKSQEIVKQCNEKKGIGCQTLLIDREVELKNCPHPADAVNILGVDE